MPSKKRSGKARSRRKASKSNADSAKPQSIQEKETDDGGPPQKVTESVLPNDSIPSQPASSPSNTDLSFSNVPPEQLAGYQLAEDLRRRRLVLENGGATPKKVGTQLQRAPPGAVCWICLGGEPDDDGQPLLRDCSCRGASGFGHLSCIAGYAKSKYGAYCRDPTGFDVDLFIQPWKDCPNCMQDYGSKLTTLLAGQCINFLENECKVKGLQMRRAHSLSRLSAYNFRLYSMYQEAFLLDEEVENAAKECLSIVEALKCKPGYSFASEVIGNTEGNVHMMLGNLSFNEKTKEGDKKAMKCLKKARNFLRGLEDRDTTLAEIELKIAQIKSREGEGESKERRALNYKSEEELRLHRRLYDAAVAECGEGGAIDSGADLAICLQGAKHGIEAERLLKEVLSTSRRVHGLHHITTQRAELALSQVTTRFVHLNDGQAVDFSLLDGDKVFRPLRYESGGEKCVLQGGIREVILLKKDGSSPSNVAQLAATSFTVDSDNVVPMPGTPVICHGLKATALNGKIGDVRSPMSENGRLEVHFEDESIGAKMLKPSNLRVLFEVPEE